MGKKSAESSTYYEFFCLTPFRAGLVTMILIGIPFRFGLLPTGILLQDWLHRALRAAGRLDDKLGITSESLELFPTQPCSLFQNDMVPSSSACKNNTELTCVYDMGQAFLHQYGLAWIIMLVIRVRPQRHWIDAILDFHRLLLTCTLASLLLLAFFQKTHPHMLKSPPFDSWIPILQVPSEIWSSRFFSSFVFYNLMALSLSLWTLLTRTQHLKWQKQKKKAQQAARNIGTTNNMNRTSTIFQTTAATRESSSSSVSSSINSQEDLITSKNDLSSVDDEFMKWSIPANALFCGAVMDGFRAIAQGQALWQNHVQDYYHVERNNVTARAMFAFGVRAFYTLLHAVWLLRIRSFLSMSQMRLVCAFQAVRHFVSILWMYWKQRLEQGDQRDYSTKDDGGGNEDESTSHYDDALFHGWTDLEWLIYISLFCISLLGYLWAGQATGISKILASGSDEDNRPRKASQRRSGCIKVD
ncbi:hypothetical protein ACA910_002968 [Epithemia clementina (nom. ined.)]